MELWLDTTNILTVQKALRCGILSGVTTNPTLISKSQIDFEEILHALLHHQKGPVTAQVTADETSEMVRQGQSLYSLSHRLIIKIPLTTNGLEAIHLLSKQGIPTMGTVVFHPRQALMGALAGADYIAPYIGHIEKTGGDPWSILVKMNQIFRNYRFKTKILGASLSTVDHVLQCAEIGIEGVTVKDELFDKLIENDLSTLKRVEQFAHDWKAVNPPPLFMSKQLQKSAFRLRQNADF